jgi:HSP20 family protein
MLARRTPRTDFLTLRDAMDRFFDESLLRPTWWSMETLSTREIPLDIFEEGDNVVVKASVPGIKPENLHIEVDDDGLRIWGEVKEEKEHKDEAYYMREHRYGRLERSALLPYAVNVEKSKAEFENGMLMLTLPKTAETKRKEIKVNVKR